MSLPIRAATTPWQRLGPEPPGSGTVRSRPITANTMNPRLPIAAPPSSIPAISRARMMPDLPARSFFSLSWPSRSVAVVGKIAGNVRNSPPIPETTCDKSSLAHHLHYHYVSAEEVWHVLGAEMFRIGVLQISGLRDLVDNCCIVILLFNHD
jgi:hypothetical protein